MHEGYFYFLKDSYYDTFSQQGVMPNKAESENQKHGRPYFYAIKDIVDKDIMWMVPISSRVEKYERICAEKKKKYNIKSYDGIVFGAIQGNKRAFLLQNMCPVISEYIDSQYMDAITNKPIILSDNTKRLIVGRAQKLIMLSKKGKRCTMTDIPFILKELVKSRNDHSLEGND